MSLINDCPGPDPKVLVVERAWANDDGAEITVRRIPAAVRAQDVVAQPVAPTRLRWLLALARELLERRR